METSFVEMVQNKFQFLINDFGFKQVTAQESPRDERWEGAVQYTTEKTYIDLNLTRGETPSLLIGRAKDKRRHLLPIQVIYEYINLTDEEKRIVLNSRVSRQVAILLREKQFSNLVPQTGDVNEKKELQLDIYVWSLREYASPMLRGDFSKWLGIWEYQVGKLTAENRRAGRPEFVPMVVTDSNGQLKVVGQQPVFKDALDYIQELKNEQKTSP